MGFRREWQGVSDGYESCVMSRAEKHRGPGDSLVVLLAVTAGSVDAWSYLGFGHVFVANMTGNTVLLFSSVGQGHWAEVVKPVLGLASYLAGVFLGSLPKAGPDESQDKMTVNAGAGLWPRRVTRVLVMECLLLIAAALVWFTLGDRQPSLVLRAAMVSVAALGLGLQSASMQVMQVPGIVTTYITGTWTTLVRNLARSTRGEHGENAPVEWEHRLAMQATVLFAYGASAAGAGLLFHFWKRGMGLLPVLALVIAILTLLLAGAKARRSQATL